MEQAQFTRLEARIDELIALCSALHQDNMTLQHEALAWQDERRRLVLRHNQVRERMELLVRRLKTLEQNA